MAIALWRLVFSQKEPPILSRWLNFLQSSDGPMVRSIQEDAWNMFLHLCETVGPDLSTYTEDDAWPSLFGKLELDIIMLTPTLAKIQVFLFPRIKYILIPFQTISLNLRMTKQIKTAMARNFIPKKTLQLVLKQ